MAATLWVLSWPLNIVWYSPMKGLKHTPRFKKLLTWHKSWMVRYLVLRPPPIVNMKGAETLSYPPRANGACSKSTYRLKRYPDIHSGRPIDNICSISQTCTLCAGLLLSFCVRCTKHYVENKTTFALLLSLGLPWVFQGKAITAEGAELRWVPLSLRFSNEKGLSTWTPTDQNIWQFTMPYQNLPETWVTL